MGILSKYSCATFCSVCSCQVLCYSLSILDGQYAWFNGVDPNAMRPTHGEELDAESCVEGESYKGKPEWECD